MNTNDKTKSLQLLLSSSPSSEMPTAVEHGSFFAVAAPTLCHPSLTIGSTEFDNQSLPDLYETRILAIKELNELNTRLEEEVEPSDDDYFVVSAKWDGGPNITLYENNQKIYEGDWKIISGLT